MRSLELKLLEMFEGPSFIIPTLFICNVVTNNPVFFGLAHTRWLQSIE